MRRTVWPLLVLSIVFGTGLVSEVAAQSAAARPDEPEAPDPAVRDSLLAEVRRYSDMISALRESLTVVEEDGSLDRTRGEALLGQALEEFGGAISGLSQELSELDLDIDDQRISLTDRDGGAIEINIPDDLGEQISRGITSITSAILSEIPDTLNLKTPTHSFRELFRTQRKAREYRVVGGDAIKLWDDIIVLDDEEVRGDIVAIFGSISVAGRVAGEVIAVFGDVELEETAEVTGQVIAIGSLHRAEEAEVAGKLVVLRPPEMLQRGSIHSLFSIGWLAFLVRQLEFLLIALLVALLLAIVPETRVESIVAALAGNPTSCFAYGILATILGHIALAILFGVLILTVIGIPLALLLLLGYVMFGLVAVATVSLQIGRWLCQHFGLAWSRKWVLVLVGLVALHLPSVIGSMLGLWPLMGLLALLFNIIGIALKVTAFCYGVGALIISRLGAPRPVSPVPAPVAE